MPSCARARSCASAGARAARRWRPPRRRARCGCRAAAPALLRCAPARPHSSSFRPSRTNGANRRGATHSASRSSSFTSVLSFGVPGSAAAASRCAPPIACVRFAVGVGANTACGAQPRQRTVEQQHVCRRCCSDAPSGSDRASSARGTTRPPWHAFDHSNRRLFSMPPQATTSVGTRDSCSRASAPATLIAAMRPPSPGSQRSSAVCSQQPDRRRGFDDRTMRERQPHRRAVRRSRSR